MCAPLTATVMGGYRPSQATSTVCLIKQISTNNALALADVGGWRKSYSQNLTEKHEKGGGGRKNREKDNDMDNRK